MSAHPGVTAWYQLEVAPDLSVDVWERTGVRPGPRALIIAGIHGDEYEGPAAVLETARTLDVSQLSGTVTAIPIANPLAFRAGVRCSPEDEQNLARVFPGNPAGSITERLASAIFDRYVQRCDFLIDLHSGGVNYQFLPVAGFYGEPSAHNQSFQAAARFGLPSLWQLPPTPGVLSYEAVRRGKVAIGHEYLGAGQLSSDGLRAYVDGVVRCLSGWKMLPDDHAPAQTPRVYVGNWQLAEQDGLFQGLVPLGANVKRGQIVANILGVPDGVHAMRAAGDGTVIGLRSRARIQQGDWGVLIASERPPAD